MFRYPHLIRLTMYELAYALRSVHDALSLRLLGTVRVSSLIDEARWASVTLTEFQSYVELMVVRGNLLLAKRGC